MLTCVLVYICVLGCKCLHVLHRCHIEVLSTSSHLFVAMALRMAPHMPLCPAEVKVVFIKVVLVLLAGG